MSFQRLSHGFQKSIKKWQFHSCILCISLCFVSFDKVITFLPCKLIFAEIDLEQFILIINYSLLEIGGIGEYERLDNHNANSALWRNGGSNVFLNDFLEYS